MLSIYFILLLKTFFALQSTFEQDGGAQPPVPVLGAASGQGESCYNVRYICKYLDIYIFNEDQTIMMT